MKQKEKVNSLITLILGLVVLVLYFLVTRTKTEFSSFLEIEFGHIVLWIGFSLATTFYFIIRYKDMIKVQKGLKKIYLISLIAAMILGFHILLVSMLLSQFSALEGSSRHAVELFKKWPLDLGFILVIILTIWLPNKRINQIETSEKES
jgi:hypothetical protein